MLAPLHQTTLLLAAHGSTEDDRPRKAGEWLTHALREKALFGEVRCCFYKHDPPMHEALESCQSRQIVILPLLMSAGFFAEKVFPKALGLGEAPLENLPASFHLEQREILYAQPLGLHAGMTQLVIQSARQCLEEYPFPRRVDLKDACIALVGHGTTRHSKSRQSAEKVVEALLKQENACHDAKAFFIEEPPLVTEILEWKTTSDHLVVVPFMMADGPHAIEDIPLALGEPTQRVKHCMTHQRPTWRNPTQRSGKHIWVAPPIGRCQQLPSVVIDHVQQLVSSPIP